MIWVVDIIIPGSYFQVTGIQFFWWNIFIYHRCIPFRIASLWEITCPSLVLHTDKYTYKKVTPSLTVPLVWVILWRSLSVAQVLTLQSRTGPKRLFMDEDLFLYDSKLRTYDFYSEGTKSIKSHWNKCVKSLQRENKCIWVQYWFIIYKHSRSSWQKIHFNQRVRRSTVTQR